MITNKNMLSRYPLRSRAGADKPPVLVPEAEDDLQVPGGFLQPEPAGPEVGADAPAPQEGYDGGPELVFTRETEPSVVGSHRDDNGSEIPMMSDEDREHVAASEYVERTSRRKLSNEDLVNVYHESLSPEQRNTIDFAFGTLSVEDRHRVMKRQENVTMAEDNGNQSTSDLSDIEESYALYSGPSQMQKGKATDPANWGNLRFAEEELDPQIQADMLMAFNIGNAEDDNGYEGGPDEAPKDAQENYEEVIKEEPEASTSKDKCSKKKNKKNKKSNDQAGEQLEVDQTDKSRDKSVDRKKKKKKRSSAKSILRPSNQIAKKSSLGQSFERMRRMQSCAPDTDSGDESPEDSSSSSDSESGTSSSSSEEGSSNDESSSSSDESGSSSSSEGSSH
ncbi:hypothetical protein H0H92_005263 [Tricholoma furcatifolium]|nr:hypothetical protein H0H92_005263 [Tricholoma furcatifolium]